ncbi:MAG: hypothetical protein KDB62_02645 [Solirubrobacterales bacterium]|nr:hypothetical protein [Solirubrobacterales bacterium]
MELKPKPTESKKKEYERELEAYLSGLLESGETLRGFCAASRQKNPFSQSVVALATTDRRLIVQTLDRKGRAKGGEVVSIRPDELASAKAGGIGGVIDDPASAVMSRTTIKLKLKTTGGEKFKFMLLDGSGIFGSFGGGEMQRQGVDVLMQFLGESEPSI